MKDIIVFIQIIISFLLIISILLQSRGSGIGSAWGGSGESYQTRRGMEKFLFIFTIILASIFFILQIIILTI